MTPLHTCNYMHFSGQPSYVNRSQRLNFKCTIIIYSGAVVMVIGLFDQTCVNAVISIIYQESLLGNIVRTIQDK